MDGLKGVILAISFLVALYFMPCQTALTKENENDILESMMSSVQQSDQVQQSLSRSRPDWKDHALFPLYEIDFPVCEDSKLEKELGRCRAWKTSGHCKKNVPVMKRFCPQTCGMCKAFAAPACQNTRFGCCWENSEAQGPNGQGCPPCLDLYRVTCPQFKKYCRKKGSNARFVRYHCFETCGRCALQQGWPYHGK